jgi:hypothetical protein
MGTVHCPLCGLRFRHGSELTQHAREDHAPPAGPEKRETVRIPRTRHAEDLETPLDQVLRSRRDRRPAP